MGWGGMVRHFEKHSPNPTMKWIMENFERQVNATTTVKQQDVVVINSENDVAGYSAYLTVENALDKFGVSTKNATDFLIEADTGTGKRTGREITPMEKL